MRKTVTLCMSLGIVSAAWAASIIDTSFSSSDVPSYADGDLAGQNGWTLIPGYTNAFNVSGAVSNGVIATVANGFTGGNMPISMAVNSTNAVDTQWDGSIDFSFSRTTNAWDGGAVLQVGLSVANSFLNPGNSSAGDEWSLRLATEVAGKNDNIVIGVQRSPLWAELVTFSPAEAGWDGAGGTDLETDNMRVVFKVRKTRDGISYALSADLINLNTSTTNTGSMTLQTVSNAYNAATLPYFVIQHDGAADIGATAERFDAAVDSISMTVTENVAPVLDVPVPAAIGLDGAVSLSWADVFEVGSYDVTWSSSSNGTYAAVPGGTGITTNGITHTGLTNGTEYWYKVTAKASGSADAVSVPVAATPESIVGNASVLNTTFTNTAIYSNGDLAGQDRWSAIAASSPKAFEVSTAGNGFADSEPFAAFATNGGNHVVYNRLVSNEVGSVWSGTTVFSINAIADGAVTTNIVGGVTNIGTVANLSGAEEFFRFGLSSDTDNTDVNPAAEDDIVWVVRNDGTDGLGIGLNMRQFNINTSLSLSRDEAGWDPLWENTDSPAPDLETDQITLDWSIRKSTIADTYNGQVVAHVGGSNYTGQIVYTLDAQSQPTAAYAASSVKFVMGHRIPAGQALYVAVDAVSMTHTNASAIPLAAPILTGQQGVASLTIDLNWSGASEADSFNIYRSEVYGSLGTLITNVTNNSYTDADPGLQDLRAYMYTVKAVYGGSTEVASDQVVARALATVIPLWYPGKTPGIDWLIGHETLDGDTDVAVAGGNGFTTFTTGNGVASGSDKSIFASSDIGPNAILTNLCPLIFMVSQNNGTLGTLRANDGGSGTQPSIRWKYADHSTLFWVDNNVGYTGGQFDASANGATITATAGNFNMNTLASNVLGYVQVAIRNGTQWYVSETKLTKNQTGTIDVLTEKWTPLTLATSTDVNRMTVTNGIYTVGSSLSLTAVNAVGYFYDNMQANGVGNSWNYMDSLKVEYGSQPSAYQNWAAGYNLYNDAAAFTNDYDGDGFSNGNEWGLGGNPVDPNNDGLQGRRSAVDGAGNFVFIYPRMIATPRPTYNVMADDNLVILPGFELLTNGVDYVETIGGTWSTNGTGANFEVVSNAVPTAAVPAMFLKLEITP